jgi:hypothetical protein
VDRVLVDGDDFFGSDAKLATRNLDASMIDKVEVIDVESKQAQLTGMADEEKTKIINLKLKDEAKKGFFGKSKQGYSNTNRYESTNMVHGFRDKLKVAAYAIADNLNSELDWQDRQDLGLDNNWSYDEELDMWIQNGGGPNNNHSGVIPQNLKIGARVSKKMEDESGSIQGKYNYQQQDFDGSTRNINTQIFDQGKDYLDKPPLLFWLSSLSMYVFGINDFAYRLPSILMAIIAIYSTYKFIYECFSIEIVFCFYVVSFRLK